MLSSSHRVKNCSDRESGRTSGEKRALCLAFSQPLIFFCFPFIPLFQDQFDLIDFSDNDILKLDNFPRMTRLHTLLLHNNYIARIGTIGEQLPHLTSLIATNNKISHFSELKNLASFCSKTMQYLSFMDNPIAAKQHYRAYLIFSFPFLKLLDFTKITVKERQASMALFSSETGKKLLAAIESDSSAAGSESKQSIFTEGQRRQLKEAIEKATSKEEIDLIEKQIKVAIEGHSKY